MQFRFKNMKTANSKGLSWNFGPFRILVPGLWCIALLLCSCASPGAKVILRPTISTWSFAALFIHEGRQLQHGGPGLSMQLLPAKPLFSSALRERIERLYKAELKVCDGNSEYNNYILLHSESYFWPGCVVSPLGFPQYGFDFLSSGRFTRTDYMHFKLFTVTGGDVLMELLLSREGGRQVISDIRTKNSSGREILFTDTLSTLINDLQIIAEKKRRSPGATR